MSDGTMDPSSPLSTAPVAASGGAAAVDAPRPVSANPTMTRPSVPPVAPPPPSQPPQRRETSSVLLVVGALVLLALLFGAGFFAGRIGAGSNDLEQATIGAITTANPSVVQVQGRGNGPGTSIGSGEILTSDGYIVTNSHVVHGLSSYMVLLSNGSSVAARLVGDVPSQDLAVLKISATDLKPIAVADSSQLQIGQSAIAVGSPLGLEQSATTGIVSALNREGREVVDGKSYTLTGMVQTSAPINPGNSGGALINLQGQLIGIPTLSAVDPTTNVAANGIGYAISSNTMESIVTPYISSGS